MHVYTRYDLPTALDDIQQRLLKGHVGILPTDTLYGLSGDASQPGVVRRIEAIKGRRKPVSLIAPSRSWALEAIHPKHRIGFEKTAARFAGPFTLLFPIAQGALQNTLASDFVGLRFPEHWVTQFTETLNRPLVTTSVNRTGQPPMHTLDDLDPEVARLVDFVVYEGPLEGPPSSLVWCDSRRPRIVSRA